MIGCSICSIFFLFINTKENIPFIILRVFLRPKSTNNLNNSSESLLVLKLVS